jgi:hypothetical protein
VKGLFVFVDEFSNDKKADSSNYQPDLNDEVMKQFSLEGQPTTSDYLDSVKSASMTSSLEEPPVEAEPPL